MAPVAPARTALEHVIQRADELGEFVALYWKEKKQPLSAGVKRGLARAFMKFDAYQLAYDRESVGEAPRRAVPLPREAQG